MTVIKSKIIGGDKLAKKLQKFGDDGNFLLEAITKSNALDMQATAQQKAPVNKAENVTGGDLKQSIQIAENTPYSYTVFTNLFYAPFVEFGTGGSVDIPKGWEEIAAQFKGNDIRKVDIPAQAYMYPAFKEQTPKYIKDITTAYRDLKKKYDL